MRLGPLLLGAPGTSVAGNVQHVVLGVQLRDVLVRFVSWMVTTDATATTRQPYLEANRGGHRTAFVWSAHTQAASLTYLYLLSPHVSNLALGTTFRGTAISEFWLPAGCELRLTLNTGQAGDTHGLSTITYQEVLQW